MTLTLRKHPKSIFFARNIDIVKDVGGGLKVQCDRGRCDDVLMEVWIILPHLVVHRSLDIHTRYHSQCPSSTLQRQHEYDHRINATLSGSYCVPS